MRITLGDEPVIDPADITRMIAAARSRPNEVCNGIAEIIDEEHYRSLYIPKVVTRPDGRLLYMSRAAIPCGKTGTFVPKQSHRQICIYAFPQDSLSAFSSAKCKTPLENLEDIEILRFLELGWDVRMVPMSDSSVAVDKPSDIPRAIAAIKALGLECLDS